MTTLVSFAKSNGSAPPPMRGERQDSYVERAERELRKRIVDRNSRTSAIMQAWRDSGEEAAIRQRVNESLASAVDCDPSEVAQHFVTRPNRPIFPEHETRDAKGNIQRYDRAALGAIVDRLNRRIMDTGDLSALSAGHTPTAEQQSTGMPMPDLVGFSGPFRLGLIGHDQPRWSIFADEHIFRDDWPRVMKMPRRSPEVWMEPRMADRILDPIAVLGAETPRLDTGIGRFSRTASRAGRRLDAARYSNVQRYSYGAAFPGGTNTFSPSHAAAEPSRNSKGSSQESDSMDQATIDEIVSSVLQGITSTPQWAYLTDQMQTAGNPVPEEADQGAPPTGDDSGIGADGTGMPGDAGIPGMPGSEQMNPPGAPMLAGGEQSGEPQPAMGDAPPDMAPAPEQEPAPEPAPVDPMAGDVDSGDESGATDDEAAQMAPDEREEYSRMAPSHQYGYMKAWRRHARNVGRPGVSHSHYSKGSSPAVEKERYAKIERQLTSLQAENHRLKAEQTFTERYSQLRDLNTQFEFDLNEEADDCRSMTADAFSRHLDRIQTRYSRRDPMDGVPMLHLEPLETAKTADEATVERYSRRAVELVTRSDGKLKYAEAIEQAKAEISVGKRSAKAG